MTDSPSGHPEAEALAREFLDTWQAGKATLESALSAFLRQHDQQTRKLLDGIHEALGEDPASDDASLPEVIAGVMRDMKLLDSRAEAFRREAASLRERLKLAEQVAERLGRRRTNCRCEGEECASCQSDDAALAAWRGAVKGGGRV